MVDSEEDTSIGHLVDIGVNEAACVEAWIRLIHPITHYINPCR